MTSERLDGAQIPPSLPPESRLRALHAKFAAMNVPMEWYTPEFSQSGPYLIIEYPVGRSSNRIFTGEFNAPDLLELDFDSIDFLADVDGFRDKATGTVECGLQFFGLYDRLSQIPGAEQIDPSIPATGDHRSGTNWRYRVSDGETTLCISQASQKAKLLLQYDYVTLTIEGLRHEEPDTLQSQVETLAASFCFDLDVNFDLPTALSRRHSLPALPETEPARSAIAFPKNEYPTEPLSLYMYGRTSRGMPLVEFLAHYQCLEYFFPLYANREAVTRLRALVTSPRFRLHEDESLVQALATVAPLISRRTTEKDMLRLVLRGVTSQESIRRFIESTPTTTEHFCTKQQALQGASRINLSGGSADLRDQIADRVYQIRCRIVHTKVDGGDSGAELLLPGSREERSLWIDIALLRQLARDALVANSQPLL